MQQMSNLDFFFLIPELKSLENGFLNNVYSKGDIFKFKFRKQNLIVDIKNAMYVSNYDFESEEPRGFLKFLRNELSNQKLLNIEQLNFDRVIKLTFTNSILIMEFATKNMILLEDGKIKSYIKESGRIVKNSEYKQLKTKINPMELKEDDFKELKGGVLPAISKILNLSVFYIEEACVRAGVKGKVEEMDKKEFIKSLKSLFDSKDPRVYYDNGIPKFFSSIPLKKIELNFKTFATLNESLDEYYSNQQKTNEKLEKLKFKLSQQEKALEEFEKKVRENREKGETIYGDYDLIKSILENPEQAIKKNKLKARIERKYSVILEL